MFSIACSGAVTRTNAPDIKHLQLIREVPETDVGRASIARKGAAGVGLDSISITALQTSCG
jgi:hypothetical protein